MVILKKIEIVRLQNKINDRKGDKMAKIETLTAYKCKFSYLKRNNPLFEELREVIEAGKEPEYSFSDFIIAYQSYTKNLAIGQNTDRAIILAENKVSEKQRKGLKMWHLVPNAGKQGKPITVIKKTSGKKYDFSSDSAALYDYHMFVYENEEGLYAIFHRQNGSGCKSVFLETANKALKPEGLKLEMELIVPVSYGLKDATATKITLQFTKRDKSSDVAENINAKKKKIIRDLGLNLEASENKKILRIIKRVQSREIDQAEAFAQIKAELKDSDDYNDAEVRLRIGSRYRKVKWNEFESVMGTHDISNSLHEAYKISHDFVGELTKLADKYYEDIIESEEV